MLGVKDCVDVGTLFPVGPDVDCASAGGDVAGVVEDFEL